MIRPVAPHRCGLFRRARAAVAEGAGYRQRARARKARASTTEFAQYLENRALGWTIFCTVTAQCCRSSASSTIPRNSVTDPPGIYSRLRGAIGSTDTTCSEASSDRASSAVLRSIVQDAAAGAPLRSIMTWRIAGRRAWRGRLTVLLGGFAAFALAIAGVGCSASSYSGGATVARDRHCSALGARRRHRRPRRSAVDGDRAPGRSWLLRLTLAVVDAQGSCSASSRDRSVSPPSPAAPRRRARQHRPHPPGRAWIRQSVARVTSRRGLWIRVGD